MYDTYTEPDWPRVACFRCVMPIGFFFAVAVAVCVRTHSTRPTGVGVVLRCHIACVPSHFDWLKCDDKKSILHINGSFCACHLNLMMRARCLWSPPHPTPTTHRCRQRSIAATADAAAAHNLHKHIGNTVRCTQRVAVFFLCVCSVVAVGSRGSVVADFYLGALPPGCTVVCAGLRDDSVRIDKCLWCRAVRE